MNTRATPGSEGKARSRLLKASRPPADAPMAAMGNASRGRAFCSSAVFVTGTVTFARAADFFFEVGMGATRTRQIPGTVAYWLLILVHEHMGSKNAPPARVGADASSCAGTRCIRWRRSRGNPIALRASPDEAPGPTRTESEKGGRPGQLIGRIFLAGPGPLAASRFAGGRSG